MKIFFNAAKHRLLPYLGWTIGSFLIMFAGWLCGAGIGYLFEALGWLRYSEDVMFSGMNFLLFPFFGGIISLIIMHIVRILCWRNLWHRYTKELAGWTSKHMLGIILLDEMMWLITFTVIWGILIITL